MKHRSDRIAVIGGGVSGLACARTLRSHGAQVTVFDRGRAVGGRMATRRGRDRAVPNFDIGAPMFAVSDDRFAVVVESWVKRGLCAWWRPRVARWDEQHLTVESSNSQFAVGVPSMDEICNVLAEDHEVVSSTAVSAMEHIDDGWTLTVEDPAHAKSIVEGFAGVVLAAAATQSGRLLEMHTTKVSAALRSSISRPIWVLMIEFAVDLPRLPDVTVISGSRGESPIDRIIRDDTKPGRAQKEGACRLVVHADSAWSRLKYDTDRDEIVEELVSATLRAASAIEGTAVESSDVRFAAAHRWGLARAESLCNEPCAFDSGLNLAACGDGFHSCDGTDHSGLEHGVQSAYLSGVAAAERLVSNLRSR